jgi:hypothetical protein
MGREKGSRTHEVEAATRKVTQAAGAAPGRRAASAGATGAASAARASIKDTLVNASVRRVGVDGRGLGGRDGVASV